MSIGQWLEDSLDPVPMSPVRHQPVQTLHPLPRHLFIPGLHHDRLKHSIRPMRQADFEPLFQILTLELLPYIAKSTGLRCVRIGIRIRVINLGQKADCLDIPQIDASRAMLDETSHAPVFGIDKGIVYVGKDVGGRGACFARVERGVGIALGGYEYVP